MKNLKMKEENITICCFLAILLLFMVFVAENQSVRISSLKRVYDQKIEFLEKEIRKKTVPHFYIQRGTIYSSMEEIIIEKIK